MEQRVRSLMQQEKFRPHPLADPLPMAFSLGAAIYPDHGNDAQELIAYADAALYEEKSGGFNLIEFTRQLEAEYLKSHPATLVQRQGKGAESGGFGMLFNLVVAVDKRDAYTKRHSEHVAQWAVHLGSFLGMADEDRQILQIAGLLHDVGKIGVPDTILRKPGALTDEEYSIMKGHVVLAKHLIQEIPHQTQVREIVACHHERWDGRGYPEGRCGTEMPLGGRILSIVDAYSAMSLDRPYRSGMALSEICQRLRQGAGTQFDPALVEPLIGLLCDATVGNVPTLSAIPCSRASAERRAA
jgi:HD-GYP domain-containing protein (c-di-GMP phosphodiesterase class II)